MYSVIITAGGIGKRMKSLLPKQFIQINEKAILMHTIETFYHFNPESQLILTLPEDWIEYWRQLCVEEDFKIPHRVISGGAERFFSIKNALEYCDGKYIAIHDGVRTLVNISTLTACFDAVLNQKAVIPVLNLKESLRKKTQKGTEVVNREDYLLVQTPQCFQREVIIEAYNQEFNERFTDDASLVEELGIDVSTVIGNDENIKITTQADLIYAELLLK